LRPFTLKTRAFSSFLKSAGHRCRGVWRRPNDESSLLSPQSHSINAAEQRDRRSLAHGFGACALRVFAFDYRGDVSR
jgi:hypothetical protein